MLTPGTAAPDFSLKDQTDTLHSLADYRGRWLVLYFYPRDNTPGCTTEACSFRDRWTDVKTKAAVLGISTDSVKSHAGFAAKYRLPFPVLADPGKEVVKAYQVWGPKKFMGREFLGTRRTTYLIDPEGRIAKVYENVKPALHVADVLADLDRLA